MIDKLRAAGWSVAIHNDYRLNGEPHTFWLFTHPNGRWIKGEGKTDAEALLQASQSAASLIRPDKPAETIKSVLDRFERSASGLVNTDYATGYREAIEHVLDAIETNPVALTPATESALA